MNIPTKKILFLVTVFSAYACVPQPTPPKNAIDNAKMVKILVDIHLAEAKVNRMTLSNYDSSQVAFNELQQRIFNKYGVDSANYRKTYDFYAMNPELMSKTYVEVVKILEEKKKKGTID